MFCCSFCHTFFPPRLLFVHFAPRCSVPRSVPLLSPSMFSLCFVLFCSCSSAVPSSSHPFTPSVFILLHSVLSPVLTIHFSFFFLLFLPPLFWSQFCCSSLVLSPPPTPRTFTLLHTVLFPSLLCFLSTCSVLPRVLRFVFLLPPLPYTPGLFILLNPVVTSLPLPLTALLSVFLFPILIFCFYFFFPCSLYTSFFCPPPPFFVSDFSLLFVFFLLVLLCTFYSVSCPSFTLFF